MRLGGGGPTNGKVFFFRGGHHSFTTSGALGARGAHRLVDPGSYRDHLLSTVHLILGTSACEENQWKFFWGLGIMLFFVDEFLVR